MHGLGLMLLNGTVMRDHATGVTGRTGEDLVCVCKVRQEGVRVDVSYIDATHLTVFMNERYISFLFDFCFFYLQRVY